MAIRTPATKGGAVLCTAKKRIPTPVCAPARNDVILQQHTDKSLKFAENIENFPLHLGKLVLR